MGLAESWVDRSTCEADEVASRLGVHVNIFIHYTVECTQHLVGPFFIFLILSTAYVDVPEPRPTRAHHLKTAGDQQSRSASVFSAPTQHFHGIDSCLCPLTNAPRHNCSVDCFAIG